MVVKRLFAIVYLGLRNKDCAMKNLILCLAKSKLVWIGCILNDIEPSTAVFITDTPLCILRHIIFMIKNDSDDRVAIEYETQRRTSRADLRNRSLSSGLTLSDTITAYISPSSYKVENETLKRATSKMERVIQNEKRRAEKN